MGRPKELPDSERQELLRRGFQPVEVWIPDWDNPAFRERIEEEARQIAASDRRTKMSETLDAFLVDLQDDYR